MCFDNDGCIKHWRDIHNKTLRFKWSADRRLEPFAPITIDDNNTKYITLKFEPITFSEWKTNIFATHINRKLLHLTSRVSHLSTHSLPNISIFEASATTSQLHYLSDRHAHCGSVAGHVVGHVTNCEVSLIHSSMSNNTHVNKWKTKQKQNKQKFFTSDF